MSSSRSPAAARVNRQSEPFTRSRSSPGALQKSSWHPTGCGLNWKITPHFKRRRWQYGISQQPYMSADTDLNATNASFPRHHNLRRAGREGEQSRTTCKCQTGKKPNEISVSCLSLRPGQWAPTAHVIKGLRCQSGVKARIEPQGLFGRVSSALPPLCLAALVASIRRHIDRDHD